MSQSTAPASFAPTAPGVSPQNDRVSLRTKAAFGLAALAENLASNGIHQLANPIYNIALGVNPALIGGVLAVGRLVDAFTDPVIGNFSDNFRSRFGRRRPLIVAGAIASGFTFLAMFFLPRGLGAGAYGTYFAVSALLFFPCFALFSVPKSAFQIELTRDYHERTRVSGFVAFVMPLGGILATWLFAFSQSGLFTDSIQGVRFTAFGVMLIMILLGSLPALLVKERHYADVARQEKISFVSNLRAVAKNRALLLLAGTGLTTMLGIFTVYSLGLYLNIYYVHGGNVKAASILHGAIGTAYQLASMAAAPVITWTAGRLGKRHTLMGCLGLALVGSGMKWLCFTPTAPLLMFLPMILMGVGMAGFWVLIASMMADVSDDGELRQGFRNEAMVGAVFAWIYKSGMSLAFMLSGFVLLWIGFDEKAGGVQPPGTIMAMRLLFSFVPALALVAALVCVWFYPITDASARVTRASLESRKGLRDL